MPGWGEALIAVACVVGIVGTILPVLPGSLLIGGADRALGRRRGRGGGLDHGRRRRPRCSLPATCSRCGSRGAACRAAGIPTRTLVAGGLLGIVGLFVVPVVGLPLGFVLGVYLAERVRLPSHADAWPSTVEAMKGTGLSVLIGLVAAVLATGIWAAVALTT